MMKNKLLKLDDNTIYDEYVVKNKPIGMIVTEYHASRAHIRKRIEANSWTQDPKKATQLRVQKAHATNLIRYGVASPAQNKEVLAKTIQTNIERYGTKTPGQNKEVQAKMASTNMIRYGTKAPAQNKTVQDKMRQTTLEKYGIDVYGKNPNTDIVFPSKETARQYFLEHYTKETLISDIADDLGYSYSAMAHMIQKFDLGDMITINPLRSKYEDEIVEYLQNLGIETIQRNVRSLDGKEVDILLPDYHVAIEFNGSFWHSEVIHDKLYHQNKSLLAEKNGVFIYHIFEYEWEDKNQKQKILNRLNAILGIHQQTIYGRLCSIRNVSFQERIEFMNENHLQGRDNCSICLGLYYEDRLVEIMSFCRPRFNKEHTWELSRLCTKSNIIVLGGANKLFKHFVQTYLHENETIISYSDITKTIGSIYPRLGFEFSHISSPNYVWYNNNSGEVKSRYQTQMKNEVEHMSNLGYIRIFDSGNKVWIYKSKM